MTLPELARRHRLLAGALSGAANRGLLPLPSRCVRTTFPDGRVMTLRVDDRTQRQMLLDRFEPDETEILRRVLGPGDTYVDVGAHVGWFVVHAAEAVGPDGRVFAFEAFPANVALLRHNVALNGFANVTVEHAAVGDKTVEAIIGTQANRDSGSATVGARAAHGLERVRQTTLDALLLPEIAPALLKIDVEGLEERVLLGARAVLDRTDAALVELNASALRANGSDPDRVVRLLERSGLVHHRMISARATRLSAASIPNVLATRGAP
jgi:FkbM family methyltransferase